MAVPTKATALMARIKYQLRPVGTTTLGRCPTCLRKSPGGQPCAECLTDDLGELIANKGAAMRWLDSERQASQDELTVLRLERSMRDPLR
ncbi:hypothetical protein [Pseudoxanthomonas putridarboris]|uniref:Uncharacterized protein n=1 Tax=Pseudoxanthomonas putridarboris TaxID=752605 RepID=A0ABU9J053_9GAMM